MTVASSHLDQLAVSLNVIGQKNTTLHKRMAASNLIDVSRFGDTTSLLLLYRNKCNLQMRECRC